MPSCPVCRGTKKTRQMGMMAADCVVCDATGTVTKEVWDKEIEERRIPTEMIKPQFTTDYRELDRLAFKNKMTDANVAFLNQPISLNKQIQNSPAHTRLNDAEIAKLKAQVKPREDAMLSAQQEVIGSSEPEAAPEVAPIAAKPRAKKSEAK